MTLQRPGKFDITDTAIAICAPAPGAKILDVGCGDGTTVAYLRERYGFDAEGVDIDEAVISEAKAANPSLPVSVADGGFLDEFLSLTFDCITMECSLSLIPMVEEALHEAWCLLKHGGKLVIHDLYDRSEANAGVGAGSGDTGAGAGDGDAGAGNADVPFGAQEGRQAGADDETKKRASEILNAINAEEVYRRAEEWKREFAERIASADEQADDILQSTTDSETASGSDPEANGKSGENEAALGDASESVAMPSDAMSGAGESLNPKPIDAEVLSGETIDQKSIGAEALSDSDETSDDDFGCHGCDDSHDAKHAGMGTVSDTLRDGMFIKDLLLTAMDDIGYRLLAFEDRTSDLESYVMEMIMAGDTPPLCAEGKKGVGYFMLVAEKPAG